MPEREQRAWRAFGDELGLLFQIVDDVLDGDGYAVEHGVEQARELAEDAAARAHDRLAAIPADTAVLAEIVAVSPPESRSAAAAARAGGVRGAWAAEPLAGGQGTAWRAATSS